MTFQKVGWWFRDSIMVGGRTLSPAEVAGTYIWPLIYIITLTWILL